MRSTARKNTECGGGCQLNFGGNIGDIWGRRRVKAEARQNLSDIHVCIVAMQARVVSETAYCDWSDELDGEEGLTPMGKSLGSDVVG